MRNLRYLGSVVLGVAMASVAVACSNPVEPTQNFALTGVAEAVDATPDDVQTEMTWVIRTQDEFQRFWDRFFARRTDRPMPTIDFTTQMVVVVTMGPQPTTGYAVRITDVSRSGRGIVVHVTTISPGPNCAVGQVRTFPVAVSRLRKTDLAVQFEFTRSTRDCSTR